MSNASISKTKVYRKTIRAAIADCIIIISFFVLFYAGRAVDSLHDLTPFLLILYAFGISICTGIVIASIAQIKNKTSRRWGVMSSAVTLLFMIMMVIFPSICSGLALLIAPLMSSVLLLYFMNLGETNRDNDWVSRP